VPPLVFRKDRFKSDNCGELFDAGYTRHRTVGRELSLFTFRIIVTVPLDYEDETNDRDCAQELSFMLSLDFISFDNTCLAALWKI
jgi:cytochrome P450